MTGSLAWQPVLIVLSGTAASIVTFTGAFPNVRPFVVLPFLLLCPGLAWVRLLRFESGLAELTLAVALSLVFATAVPAGMLYAGAWSPRGSFAVLFALTLVALVLEFIVGDGRRGRRREAAP
ncbi:MAG: hypothetical protein LC799_08140 [Actinobacteria bacterium]|nr:hypothetical protein [Actinomycetota bacterium]